MTIGGAMYSIRNMVDAFVREHSFEWNKYRDAYQEQSRLEHLKLWPESTYKGVKIGVPLSMQSYIASDLLIDFVFLALEVEGQRPFVREYWLRSQGVQCIKDAEDIENNRKVFSDIVAKIKVEFDGKEFTKIEWFEDEDCKIKNHFIHK